MDDITSIEDNPGGKKGHFIIHFDPMHMHLKSDNISVKDKWFNALSKLWKHYKSVSDVSEKVKPESPKIVTASSSPSHYKSQKINPKYLLEIAASEDKQKLDPKVSKQIAAKLKECMIQNSLDLLESIVYENHVMINRMRLAIGRLLPNLETRASPGMEDEAQRKGQKMNFRNFEQLKQGVCLLIASKSLAKKDQDFRILSSTDIPAWLELNTIYFFSLETSAPQGKPGTDNNTEKSTAPDIIIRPLNVLHIQLVASERQSFDMILMTREGSFLASFERPTDYLQFEAMVVHARDLDRETQRSTRGMIDWSIEAVINTVDSQGIQAVQSLAVTDLDRIFPAGGDLADTWKNIKRSYEHIEKVGQGLPGC